MEVRVWMAAGSALASSAHSTFRNSLLLMRYLDYARRTRCPRACIFGLVLSTIRNQAERSDIEARHKTPNPVNPSLPKTAKRIWSEI